MIRTVSLLSFIICIAISTGCAETFQARNVETSGFLEDYSMLGKGGEGEALLVYLNPKTNWKQYDKIIFPPVAIWRQGESELKDIPEEELAHLAIELWTQVEGALKNDYQFVKSPGPGVLRLEAAITEAEKSNPALDILTTIHPGTRATSALKNLATGTESFVGKAAVEAKMTDSQSGELLMAAVDRRGGGKYLWKGIRSWTDVEAAYEYWGKKLQWRLCTLRGGTACEEP